VAGAIRRAFPDESILYLGDTARVPYGTKSPETVLQYTRENIAFLLSFGVKAIVAACNTVSAAALPKLEEHYPTPVLGVVEMGAEAALAPLKNPRRIGVIGTETTIASGAYVHAIHKRAPDVEVLQKACPLFVPLIEEGWLDHAVTRQVAEEYLSPMRETGIDVLILGCTHYPLIRRLLQDFFGSQVRVVDSAQAMTIALGKSFDEGQVDRAPSDATKSTRYFVTDRCNHFRELLEAFLGENGIEVEQIGSDVLTEAFEKRMKKIREQHL